MDKSNKIVGFVSVLVIFATVFWLYKTRLVMTTDNQTLYIVGAVVILAFLTLTSHYLVIGFLLRRRANAFKIIANDYALEHSHIDNLFFIPYGKLNTISGTVNGHRIEVVDESFVPRSNKLAGYIARSSIFAYASRKSANMSTKIYVDGKNVTPDYSQKWIFYRNPFMKVDEIREYLSQI